MYVAHVSEVPESNVTPDPLPPGKRATVRWVIAEEHGAPNFEMRVFHLDEGLTSEWHRHPWEHEVYVLTGHGTLRGETGETELEPGTVVLIAGGEMHQLRASRGEALEFICVVPRGTKEKAASPAR